MLRTGWTEPQLDATSRATREEINWVLYAELLAGAATRDLDAMAQDLDDQKFLIEHPKPEQRKRLAMQRLGQLQVQVALGRETKARAREILWPADDETVN